MIKAEHVRIYVSIDFKNIYFDVGLLTLLPLCQDFLSHATRVISLCVFEMRSMLW